MPGPGSTSSTTPVKTTDPPAIATPSQRIGCGSRRQPERSNEGAANDGAVMGEGTGEID